MNFWVAIDETYQLCLTSFFLTLHIIQETSAVSSEDEWYKNTLDTLKKFSPTSLKVTLRSVSSYIYTCSKLFLKVTNLVKQKPKTDFLMYCTCFVELKCDQIDYFNTVVCLLICFWIQIREGRQQSLAQCLEREYRLSVRAVNATYTTDFYEVGFINSDVRNSICVLSLTSICQKCSRQQRKLLTCIAHILWDVHHITLKE